MMKSKGEMKRKKKNFKSHVWNSRYQKDKRKEKPTAGINMIVAIKAEKFVIKFLNNENQNSLLSSAAVHFQAREANFSSDFFFFLN